MTRLKFLGALLLLTLAAALLPLLPRGGESLPAAAAEEPKLVALTFDDGPKRSTTAALLDGLAQRGVHATFFLIGLNVDGNEDLILRMEAEGHQVGVHSQNHKLLTGLNAADFYAEVDTLRLRLEALLGHGGLPLRPPYGMTDESVSIRADAPIIHWSIDPEDWSDGDVERQCAHILSRVQDGDIILLHDIYPSSVETALQVADALLAEGYFLVTVEELFEAKGIPLKNGTVYMHAR